jgi:uncharacterized protein
MDVVLDTNIVVSAAISRRGPPGQIIVAWRNGSFDQVTSAPLVDELQRKLMSDRLRAYLTWNQEEVAEFLDYVRHHAKIVAPTRIIEVIKDDPDDNRVLEAAVEGEVDYIVSGDRDLLGLGEYANIPIVTPARFVAVLRTGLG